MTHKPASTVLRKVVLTEETVTTRTIRRIALEDVEFDEEPTATRSALPARRVLAKCGAEPKRLAGGVK